MKRLLIILLSLGIGFAVEAQPKVSSGVVRKLHPQTRVVRVAPIYPIRPYLGFGYGFGYRFSPFYSPFYSPFNAFGPVYDNTPSQLELELEDIRNEYQYQISSVRRDETISKEERREKIRELKHQRDNAIIDAKRSYYKQDQNDVSK